MIFDEIVFKSAAAFLLWFAWYRTLELHTFNSFSGFIKIFAVDILLLARVLLLLLFFIFFGNALFNYIFYTIPNLNICFGRGFPIVDAIFLGESFTLLFRYVSIIFQIYLVSNENFDYASTGVLLNGLHPRFDIFERVGVSNTEGDHDSISLLVKGLCQSLESLLASSIPKFDSLRVACFRGILTFFEIQT